MTLNKSKGKILSNLCGFSDQEQSCFYPNPMEWKVILFAVPAFVMVSSQCSLLHFSNFHFDASHQFSRLGLAQVEQRNETHRQGMATNLTH
jgi:hypothetical protein